MNSKIIKWVEILKNKTINTIYGESVVVGLTDDLNEVCLLELGEELYTLSLADFYSQLVDYNSHIIKE